MSLRKHHLLDLSDLRSLDEWWIWYKLQEGKAMRVADTLHTTWLT